MTDTTAPLTATAIRSAQDREAAGRNRWLIVAGLVIALLLVLPLIATGQFMLHVGIMICLGSIGASSLHLIIRTGHVSLGHAAFMGVGAYTSVYLVMKMGVPFPIAAAAGAVNAGILALLIGPVILRLTGKYFVLITFMMGEIVRMVFVDWLAVTGGANGIYEIPPPSPMFLNRVYYYYLAVGAALVCVGFCARMLTSEIGRTIDSMREGEKLAECSGVPVIRYKVMVFVIACALVGLQGALHAHYARYISPTNYSGLESLNFVVMNVLGGMQTLAGPIIGAMFMMITPEFLRGYVQLQWIIFGVLLIVVMAFMPTGIVGLIEKLWSRGRSGR